MLHQAQIIYEQLYSKDKDGKNVKLSDLSEADKQNLSALAQLASGLAVAAGSGGDIGDTGTAVAGSKNAVENNFLTDKRPLEYAQKLKACNNDSKCEKDIRREIAIESAENISKLKSCWDAGDNACVADIRDKIALIDDYYNALHIQDPIAGEAYRNSASLYADIIDHCPNCDWLEAQLAKVAADNITISVYGALGGSALPGNRVPNAGRGTGLVAQGEARVVSSKVIQPNTTVKLTENIKLPNGEIIPRGSIVTVSENTMKVTYSDGTSKISNYDKVKSSPLELPNLSAGKGTPTVTAELEVNGVKFKDTNQTARPVDKANSNETTLIADKIRDKEIATGKELPNGNMANAHAEIGVIQQAHNAGLAKGADLKINVAGKEICSYCRSDIVSAAKAADVKSVTIYEEKTGLTYYWRRGMKKLEVQK